jgi:hypothetical protein
MAAADTTFVLSTIDDRERAHEAFRALMDTPAERAGNLDLALYGTQGSYVVLVAVRGLEAEGAALDLLRHYGATIREQRHFDMLSNWRNDIVHGRRSTSELDDAAVLAFMAVESGVLKAADALALLLTCQSATSKEDAQSRKVSRSSRSSKRREQLRAADAELDEVSRRLESALTSEWPELFDRRGRLRKDVLARRLAERTGGKQWLSGDDLLTLEDAADAQSARSASAP